MKKKTNAEAAREQSSGQAPATMLVNLERSKIMLSDLNPRKTYDESSIDELAASISHQGLLQPVTVRPVCEGIYEVVCGSRRFKAIQKLGWDTVPVIIRELDDAAALDAMITENLQRSDVDPIEESDAFCLLVSLGHTVEDLAARFGKSDKYIRGRLSLRKLEWSLRSALRDGRLSLTGALKLARLDEEQQRSFYIDRLDYDEGKKPPHVGADEVLDYIEGNSVSLGRQPFLGENMSELMPDSDRYHACAGCPFNSASQISLFPELSCDAQCLNPDCLKKKQYAWQEWFIERYRDRLLPKGDEPDRDSVVLVTDPVYGDSVKKRHAELKDAYCEFEIMEYGRDVSRCHGQPSGDTITGIDLAALVYNCNPIRTCILNRKTEGSAGRQKTSWKIRNSLVNLRLRRNEAVTKALEPIFKKHVDAERLLTADNTVLDAVIARACSDFGGYRLMDELDLHVTDSLVDALMGWVGEHSLRELIALTALKVCEYGTINERGSLMQYLTFALEPERSKEATDKILQTMQKREDKLNAELAELEANESQKH